MNQDATTIEDELVAKLLLSASHRESGNIEASYKCSKEIVETTLCVFGEERTFTSTLCLDSVIGLAYIANTLGHQEEAFGWINWVDRGIQNGAIERSLAESNLVTCFATIYNNIGQHDKALPYAERSVQLWAANEKSVEDTWNKLVAKTAVASIYSNLGQRDKAVTIQKGTYKEARKKLGPSHPTTKETKQRLAELEASWVGAPELSDVQAGMTACKGRTIMIGFLHEVFNREDLSGTPAEIRLYSREKRQYLVRLAGGDGSQLYVKPSNIIFKTVTSVHVHGLQNAKRYNGRLGKTKDYSHTTGRYAVKLEDMEKMITVKPENLVVQYQPDLVFDATQTLEQMLSHPNACY
jgi:hypothetical protein